MKPITEPSLDSASSTAPMPVATANTNIAVGRILRPFAESPTLTTMFGSEERFLTISDREVAALASPAAIVDFLKQKSLELAKAGGGKALEWVSAQLLNAIGLGGGPSELEQIKNTLREILENQRIIIGKLDQLLREVQFQHLITRSFDSVERITNMYERMQRLSTVGGKEEREREAALLKSGILDPNLGTMLNLKSISDVMLGKDQLGQGDALINAFVDRWFPVYTAKQLADDIPLSTYRDKLEAWLHGVFVIQFMGLAELANARISNRDFELLKQEIDAAVGQMEAQRNLLEQSIPGWTKSLPNSLFDGRWYVVRGRDLRNGQIDNSQVMYGSPAAGSYLDYTVQFRDRHHNNGDEEWRFEKTGQNDTFWMVERSRPNYVRIDGPRLMVGAAKDRVKMRIVMDRTNDPAVRSDAPRRDLYVPAIGFVGRGDYMTWTRFGTNVVFVGPLDKAVRLQIEHSGH